MLTPLEADVSHLIEWDPRRKPIRLGWIIALACLGLVAVAGALVTGG